MRELLVIALVSCLFAPPALAQEGTSAEPMQRTESCEAAESMKEKEHGLGHTLLLYIPNRIFDVLDIIRLRVRAGPGISVNARATAPISVFLGGHTALWAGLPGPRGKPKIAWPLGFETRAGAQVSLADGTVDETYYAPVEFDVGAQVILLGLEIGVAPLQVVDLALGLLTIDLSGDDL
ncbi:MAG: hypothetical protein GY722_23560 [bacterium]|nr:hypothetical protein [bacterium]